MNVRCPVCYTEVSLRTIFSDDPPRAGDRVICAGCASFSQFDDDMILRALSPEQLAQDEHRQLMEEARSEVIASWDPNDPPTLFAWAILESLRKSAGEP